MATAGEGEVCERGARGSMVTVHTEGSGRGTVCLDQVLHLLPCCAAWHVGDHKVVGVQLGWVQRRPQAMLWQSRKECEGWVNRER